MSKIIKIFIGLFFVSLVSMAQNGQIPKDTGHVQFIQDVRVVEMINKKTQINEKKDGKIQGFRVQIHFGSDRDKAKEVKSKFIQKYDSIPAYERYEQPNFKIRVGDFRTRLEAYRFFKTVTAEFPGSFIVEDEIEMKELVK